MGVTREQQTQYELTIDGQVTEIEGLERVRAFLEAADGMGKTAKIRVRRVTVEVTEWEPYGREELDG